MAYQIKETFNARLGSNPELMEALQQFADEHEINSTINILVRAMQIAGYLGEFKRKKAAPKAPESSDQVFSAKIHRLDIDRVKKMREELYEAHRYEDPQIIAHWAKVHSMIEANQLFMVKPPKNVAAKIVEKGQPLVDNGELPSLGHFIATICKKELLSAPKKESSSFWE